jgi:cytochrome c-type biogenesis protein CcmH/NrfF
MKPVRHPLLLLAVALLLLAAGTAVWRSAAPVKEDAGTIAAQLVCPACQGESVAQSQSPMAAAMRDTIAQQLAAGRSADQVRQWFVDRYGRQILADPPHGGLGVLLWLLPAAAAAAMVLLFIRSLRRRAAPPAAAATATSTGPASPRRARRAWDAVALAVVALVGAVALAAPHRGPASGTASAAPAATSDLVDVARSLEGQGRYAEAAQVYQDVVEQQPADDAIRLRLALTLLRANQPAAAAANARQVLAHAPGNTQALLMLGLAQRAAGSSEATATLRRFLAAAPQDPAAAEVRRLLAGR